MILHSIIVLSEIALALRLWLIPGRKQFASFRALVFFLAPKDACLFVLSASSRAAIYFYAYYLFALIEVPLTLWVVYEVMRELFAPTSILPVVTLRQILASAWGVTAACLVTSVLFPLRFGGLLFSAAWTAERTSIFIECCLLWVAFAFARILGIPWRKRLLGIAVGLTIQTSAASIALLSTPSQLVGLIVMASGLAQIATWFAFHCMQEPALIFIPQREVPKLKKPCGSITGSYTAPIWGVDRHDSRVHDVANKIRRAM